MRALTFSLQTRNRRFTSRDDSSPRNVRRSLFLTGIAALAVLWSAPAQAGGFGVRVAGRRTFELGSGKGLAVIGGRGAALGNLGGRIKVIHVPGGAAPRGYVRGCATKSGSFSGRFTCRGSSLRFLVYGGTWRIRMTGARINVSGRIRGRLGLDRAEDGSGWFTIGSSDSRRWPATLTFYAVRS
jgi:hypothetical protein